MINYFSEEYRKLWKLSNYPASFYRMFGFVLSHYASTFNPRKNIVQSFSLYADEVSETKRINNFQQLCRDLLQEIDKKEDLAIDTLTDELNEITRKTIVSPTICNYLQSISFKEPIELFNTLFKPTFGTYPLSLNQRMEFITGVYLNHSYSKTKFLFCNNYAKMSLTHQFMINLAEEDDLIVVTSIFKTPHTHLIEINENGPFRKTLTLFMERYGYQ